MQQLNTILTMDVMLLENCHHFEALFVKLKEKR